MIRKIAILLVTLSFILSSVVITDAAFTRRKHNKPYGVLWDESNSSPTLTRVGQGKTSAAAAKMSNSLMIVQALMQRVILNDGGVVQYYLCATDSTKKVDCSTASNLDGSDGQVMLEIPQFWLKYSYSGTNHTWIISKEQFSGASALEAFYKNGAWVDFRYIGAYEGVGYDNSTSAYFDGDDAGNSPTTNWPGGTAIDTANDLLASVTGWAPLMNEKRDEFRSIAANRGSGWRQQDFYLVSAIQLLYLVEYASFYSQSVIGPGRTQLTGGTWAKGSNIKEGGNSNGDGNATNAVAYSGDADDAGAEAAYMTYRGVENFFGNIWGWVDGFNINGNIPYVSNTDTDFADNTGANYTRLEDTSGSGITLHNADGYQTTLEQTKSGFLPSAVGGDSNTYITDNYYQNTDWRVAMFGGHATNGDNAGFFDWNLNSTVFDDYIRFGARLAY